MLSVKCRRCRALAHYELMENDDIAIRCRHCGEIEWVQRQMPEGMVIRHVHVDEEETRTSKSRKLPDRNSRLYRCLACLADHGNQKSSEVAQRLELDKSKVAIAFSVLTSRGLVRPLESNKGKKGGSLWTLTSVASELLRR